MVESKGGEGTGHNGGWDSYRRFVLGKLEQCDKDLADAETRLNHQMEESEGRLNDRLVIVEERTTELQILVAQVQVRASLWGGFAGLGAILIYAVYSLIRR